MKLLFADTETTGTEAEDRLCQLAFRLDGFERQAYYKPPLPIKIGAMAVHHITEEMVADQPPFIGSLEHSILTSGKDQMVFVAHNAKFDLGMLAKEGVEMPHWIDTLKIARYLDEKAELESYSLQYLRYYHGVRIDATAHDALGDVLVLEKIFWLLRDSLMRKEGTSEEETISRMMDISSSTVLLRRFQFGKYKGELVEHVANRDRGYLQWLQREKLKEPAGEEDWLFTLEHYLKKR